MNLMDSLPAAQLMFPKSLITAAKKVAVKGSWGGVLVVRSFLFLTSLIRMRRPNHQGLQNADVNVLFGSGSLQIELFICYCLMHLSTTIHHMSLGQCIIEKIKQHNKIQQQNHK